MAHAPEAHGRVYTCPVCGEGPHTAEEGNRHTDEKHPEVVRYQVVCACDDCRQLAEKLRLMFPLVAWAPRGVKDANWEDPHLLVSLAHSSVPEEVKECESLGVTPGIEGRRLRNR